MKLLHLATAKSKWARYPLATTIFSVQNLISPPINVLITELPPDAVFVGI